MWLKYIQGSQFRPVMCVREVYGFPSGKVCVECEIGIAVIRKLCFVFPLMEVNCAILE